MGCKVGAVAPPTPLGGGFNPEVFFQEFWAEWVLCGGLGCAPPPSEGVRAFWVVFSIGGLVWAWEKWAWEKFPGTQGGTK